MDLSYSEADERFRKEVRAWLDEHGRGLRIPAATRRLAGPARV